MKSRDLLKKQREGFGKLIDKLKADKQKRADRKMAIRYSLDTDYQGGEKWEWK